MLLVVTGIGSLIHIYAIGYMAHEGGYYRFFAYLNLFMFFMLTLVLAANYLVLFVGWEGVGLCSYLLIGFYFDKKFATDAGNKAFIVNRIGDFGFSLAMFLIVVHFGSLDFGTVFTSVAGKPQARSHGHRASAAARRVRQVRADSAVCLAAGRHGRPHARLRADPRRHHGHGRRLHDGALGGHLHARARRHGSRERIIGIATAFFAATIGLAQNDIKKVFAYSTVSQLGYMFLGVGLRRVFGGHLPPDDARVLQGAAVPRRGQRDSRAGRRAGHAQHGRAAQEDSLDLLDDAVRLAWPSPACRPSRVSLARTRFWRPPISTRRGCTGWA